MSFSISGALRSFVSLTNPLTAPAGTVNLLQSVLGNNSASSFSAAGTAGNLLMQPLMAILNPSSTLGRAAVNTLGQNIPQLMTPNVASVLQSSALATTAANAFGSGNVNGTLQSVAATQGTSESQVVANMGPGVRDMYNQLLKDDPKQARAFLIQEMMASLKLMGEILSNVSKTRSEISMTFARNSRA